MFGVAPVGWTGSLCSWTADAAAGSSVVPVISVRSMLPMFAPERYYTNWSGTHAENRTNYKTIKQISISQGRCYVLLDGRALYQLLCMCY